MSERCDDCAPEFTECWNDGSKCRKQPSSFAEPTGSDSLMDLDTVVRVMWGTGEQRELARVVGICDAPTFILELEDGSQLHWRQDLCRGATERQEVEYWKARALRDPNAVVTHAETDPRTHGEIRPR